MSEGADHPVHETVRLPAEVDVASVAHLRPTVATALHARPDRLTFDLSDVGFIDSVGLGLLVGTLRRCTEDGIELTLEGVGPGVRRVFDMTGLLELFRVSPAG